MATPLDTWWLDSASPTNWWDSENTISVGSFFSGIDSYAHALKKAGVAFRHCFVVEHDKFCCKTLRKTFQPELFLQQDIRTVSIDLLPSVDLFCASPPCAPYSSLGVADPNDPRRDLINPILEYITLKKPNVVVVENVTRFEGSDACQTLRRLLLDQHYTVGVKVLDASAFGSPQKRKRLFVVGVARHCMVTHSLPWPDTTPHSTQTIDSTVLEPLDDLPEHVWLTRKGEEYLFRRRDWGAQIFQRDHRGAMPTFCKSHGHMVHWRHTIMEYDGRLRKLTCREIARLCDYPEDFPVDICSRTQTQYQFGNAICLRPLSALLRTLCELVQAAKDNVVKTRVRVEERQRTFRF